MDEAALMLESGDDALARIATRVGYETTTAFSKAFKQHYSFSPGHYRARNGTKPPLSSSSGNPKTILRDGLEGP
jgi:AraC-like DNA-binding protein